jgi:succinate dehydrogenase / fumarate reductase cytochrome b subunit
MYQFPDKRPVLRNPLAFRYPLAAVLSIMHRLSGMSIVLLGGLAFVWGVWLVVAPQAFEALMQGAVTPTAKIGWSLLALSLWWHWLTGLRHLLVEHNVFGLQTNAQTGHRSAVITIAAFGFGTVLIVWGVWV